jgi:hypothetical protein
MITVIEANTRQPHELDSIIREIIANPEKYEAFMLPEDALQDVTSEDVSWKFDSSSDTWSWHYNEGMK